MTNRLTGYFCLCIVFYALLCFLYSPFVVDDAYLVGRYALNAADGLGLVYNPSEQISALTSPLHALLETGLSFLTNDPVAFYRILAPSFPVIALLVAFRVYRPESTEMAFVAVFGLASPFMALWSVAGLETPILSAFLTVFVAFVFKAARMGMSSGFDLLALGILAALAFLTRHDSILLTAPLLCAIAFLNWRRSMLWTAALVFVGLAGAWLVVLWRHIADIGLSETE